MPTRTEAFRLNLEYYRKQAKALLKAAKTGDPKALERLSRHSLNGKIVSTRHGAQLTIAREQGFRSWPRFRAFLIQSRLDFSSLANSFIEAALSNLKHAQEILAEHPQVAHADLYASLVTGDVKSATGRSRIAGLGVHVARLPRYPQAGCVPCRYGVPPWRRAP